jgi:transposase
MAGKTMEISMIKQVLRMNEQGTGHKTIARALGISRNTVKGYVHQVEQLGLKVSELLLQSDDALAFILSGKDSNQEAKMQEVEALFPTISSELEKTGFTLYYLWSKYKLAHPEGYQYSQFCFHFQKYRTGINAVMHFEHEAGDKLFLDYAGKKLSYVIYGSGEIVECEVFVAVLGYSQYTYVEASISQRKEDFIASVQNALHYYGGVPKVLVPDNLKSAVDKSCRYDPCVNEDFLGMANHYGCAVLPCRSRKPRDKSLVENHVRIMYTRVYAELSDQQFFTLEELNKAILHCIEIHNGMLFQGKDYSRKQAFEEVEQQALQALPCDRYELKKKDMVTVMQNSYVRLGEDKHYYSVPFRYIGEKVKIEYTSKDVSVFLKGERIACHLRNRKPYKYTTVEDHLPTHHRFVSDWNPEKFINWAAGIHPIVKAYIEGILSQSSYPESLYRGCVGVLSMNKKAGKERLIKACQLGIQMNTYNYGFISRTLSNGTDKLLTESDILKMTSLLPDHENLRGADYYKDICNNNN